jgi:hypothetical protein
MISPRLKNDENNNKKTRENNNNSYISTAQEQRRLNFTVVTTTHAQHYKIKRRYCGRGFGFGFGFVSQVRKTSEQIVLVASPLSKVYDQYTCAPM